MDGTVIRGDVVDEVVKYAEEEKAGLVIIGTHGTKGLERILLGSVAERVLKSVHCPTLTMNPYR
jgi:nucleotide-binding universal stress UspA family protein